MRVALVYDRINKWGGAESVLLALHEVFPDAPLFTSVYDKNLAPWANVFEVHTSFLQNLPIPKNKHEYYPFLMGFAFESFNFDEFDVVISVTSEFAKGIITKPTTLHICYCLTPTSYLWAGYDQYFSDKSELFKSVTGPLIRYLRFYDKIISRRPDKYIAISSEVRSRIKKYYHLESELIYPPVSNPISVDGLKNENQHEKYFLIVSRLVPNKRIDIAVDAFNSLNLPLKIVGTGRQESELKAKSKNNIEFVGSLTEQDLNSYYDNCLALIVPASEDFGIVSLEAQSHGKPVIAYKAGGLTETVIENKTGWFFDRQEPDCLTKKIKEIESKISKIDPKDCIVNSKKYSKEIFMSKFKQMIRADFEEKFK